MEELLSTHHRCPFCQQRFKDWSTYGRPWDKEMDLNNTFQIIVNGFNVCMKFINLVKMNFSGQDVQQPIKVVFTKLNLD